MFHGEVDAEVELDPGKGRVIIPEDFQSSTGQGPVQPDLHDVVALGKDLYHKLFNNSMIRKYKLVSLLNVPDVNVD